MHYLLYVGHPETIHATFTVYVWSKQTKPTNTDLARLCKSSISVKKIHLLAEIDDKILFTKLDWQGKAKISKLLDANKLETNPNNEPPIKTLKLSL